ncbi:MAG: hypothetical protein V5A52_08755 [Halovenus sp.]|uniref:hypothetical protein n=1 Tax=Halovenus amylolytica TaxID=2500550 RepID=UPI000FE3F13F
MPIFEEHEGDETAQEEENTSDTLALYQRDTTCPEEDERNQTRSQIEAVVENKRTAGHTTG